ncbi:hypothetical protein GPALN_001794 [Globodera pallida]|nr:hypothetical protein GPALN_001794 [Globodera pallida]
MLNYTNIQHHILLLVAVRKPSEHIRSFPVLFLFQGFNLFLFLCCSEILEQNRNRIGQTSHTHEARKRLCREQQYHCELKIAAKQHYFRRSCSSPFLAYQSDQKTR